MVRAPSGLRPCRIGPAQGRFGMVDSLGDLEHHAFTQHAPCRLQWLRADILLVLSWGAMSWHMTGGRVSAVKSTPFAHDQKSHAPPSPVALVAARAVRRLQRRIAPCVRSVIGTMTRPMSQGDTRPLETPAHRPAKQEERTLLDPPRRGDVAGWIRNSNASIATATGHHWFIHSPSSGRRA